MNCLSSVVLLFLLANTFGNPSFHDSQSIFQKEPWNNKIGSRIVGGVEAGKAVFPYQVSLQNYGNPFCGGSILNENWILTAGHCLSGAGPSQVTVVVGTNNLIQGGIEYNSRRLIVHPDYSGYELTNDIGLIELDSPLTFSSLVKPISLPTKNTQIPNTPVVVTGWGRNSVIGDEFSPVLRYLDLKIVGQKLCTLFNKERVTEKNICTVSKFGKAICKGDSGDPIVLGGKYQVGIVSWEVVACGALGVPDVHTRVYSYVDWIKGYIYN